MLPQEHKELDPFGHVQDPNPGGLPGCRDTCLPGRYGGRGIEGRFSRSQPPPIIAPCDDKDADASPPPTAIQPSPSFLSPGVDARSP